MRMQGVDEKTQLAFSAAISERLLQGARTGLRRWRKDAWTCFRQALDSVWEHLDRGSLDRNSATQIKEACVDYLPTNEIENDNFESNACPGAHEACAAVIYTFDLLINANPEDAVRVSSQAYNAIRAHVIRKSYADVRSGSYSMQEAIYESEPIQAEIRTEELQLARLAECAEDMQEFARAFHAVKKESLRNPIDLPDKWE